VIRVWLTICLLLIINVPSVKLIWSSTAVNVAALAGVWFFGLMGENGRDLTLPRVQYQWLLATAVTGIWCLGLAATVTQASAEFTFSELGRVVVSLFMVIGAAVFAGRASLGLMVWGQQLWALVLALLWLLGLIQPSRDLGQHYLTIGLPVGMGMTLAIVNVLAVQKNGSRLVSGLVALVSLLALSSLLGRSPLLVSAATIILVFLQRTRGLRPVQAGVAVAALAAIGWSAWVLLKVLARDALLSRFASLFLTIGDEPRLYYYSGSIELLSRFPWGLGFRGIESELGSYPHNIFLDVATTGGLPALAIFFWVAWQVTRAALRTKRSATDQMALAMSVYALLMWNVSFDLSSAYVPLTATLVFLAHIGRRPDRRRSLVARDDRL